VILAFARSVVTSPPQPRSLATAKKCAATTDCASLVQCVVPLQEGRIKMQAEQEAKQAK
jgi:hypothetical protein